MRSKNDKYTKQSSEFQQSACVAHFQTSEQCSQNSRRVLLACFRLEFVLRQILKNHDFSVKEKENDEKTGELPSSSFGMTLELPGQGKSPRHKIGLDKFRKESLRPNAEINSGTVLKQCREFEEIWTGHMEQNREKWTIEQEKGTFGVLV